jgi:hypothetical protein
VPPPPPTVAQVQVTPGSVAVPMGGTAAFTAQGYQANGTPIAVAVGWSATGGTRTPGSTRPVARPVPIASSPERPTFPWPTPRWSRSPIPLHRRRQSSRGCRSRPAA